MVMEKNDVLLLHLADLNVIVNNKSTSSQTWRLYRQPCRFLNRRRVIIASHRTTHRTNCAINFRSTKAGPMPRALRKGAAAPMAGLSQAPATRAPRFRRPRTTGSQPNCEYYVGRSGRMAHGGVRNVCPGTHYTHTHTHVHGAIAMRWPE